MRRNLLLAVSLAALLILAAACTPKPTPTPEPTTPPTATPEGPDLDLPAALDPSIRFDPAVTADADTLRLCALVYDGLTTLDADGNPQPALATGWSVSDDQLDYVLTLRQGVSFHLGHPFDADAVLANFNRWFDPANPLHVPGAFTAWETEFLGFKGDLDPDDQPLSSFDGIEKVDNYTVLIHLNRPVPDLMTKLALPAFLILDPSLLAASAEAYGSSVGTTNGTGAYALSAWTDAGLEFTPNTAYWDVIPEEGFQIPWK